MAPPGDGAHPGRAQAGPGLPNTAAASLSPVPDPASRTQGRASFDEYRGHRASLPQFPHLRLRGRKGRLAAPLQLDYRTLGHWQLGRSGGSGCPLGEGAGLRLPALTWLTLQRHHGHQVVGDVKKGEHRCARKGKGQIIPRRIHDDDRPQQAKQPGRRVPAVRSEKWGRGPPRPRARPRALPRGLEEPCACALRPAPERFGAGPCVPGVGGASGFPAVPAGLGLVLQVRVWHLRAGSCARSRRTGR